MKKKNVQSTLQGGVHFLLLVIQITGEIENTSTIRAPWSF